tara:strand:+ start:1422 stop:2258 length:837 start_codon:yes stop_codon:yes gene_type:complete
MTEHTKKSVRQSEKIGRSKQLAKQYAELEASRQCFHAMIKAYRIDPNSLKSLDNLSGLACFNQNAWIKPLFFENINSDSHHNIFRLLVSYRNNIRNLRKKMRDMPNTFFEHQKNVTVLALDGSLCEAFGKNHKINTISSIGPDLPKVQAYIDSYKADLRVAPHWHEYVYKRGVPVVNDGSRNWLVCSIKPDYMPALNKRGIEVFTAQVLTRMSEKKWEKERISSTEQVFPFYTEKGYVMKYQTSDDKLITAYKKSLTQCKKLLNRRIKAEVVSELLTV